MNNFDTEVNTLNDVKSSSKTEILTKNKLSSVWLKNALTSTLVMVMTIGLSAQCALICNEDITVSLFSTNNLTIPAEMLLVNPGQNCPSGNYQVDILDGWGNSLGNVVNYEYIGTPLTFTVTDATTEQSCTGQLTLEDRVAPTITCQTAFIACYVSAEAEDTGYPEVSDNIDDLNNSDLTYFDVFTDLNCFTQKEGQTVTAQIERHWTVEDQSGNASNCIQSIYMRRSNLEDVVFPADLDGIGLPALVCNEQDPNDTHFTGKPMIGGIVIEDDNTVCEFSVLYTDQVTNFCTGNTRILRNWSVVDQCNDEVRTDVQIIEIKDETPPVITCPDTLRMNSVSGNCESTVVLSNAIGQDNCSQVSMITQWEFGTGNGPFYNVPFGTHLVTYRAQDECENQTVCTSVVIVGDDTPPTPVCDEGIDVNLQQPSQSVVLYADAFDKGSHDNCALDRFEISSDNIIFSPSMTFTCEDIIVSPIQLIMRVYDVNGFFNDCYTQVSVTDLVAPTLTCPEDITLDCTGDYLSIDNVGEATAEDACGIDVLDFSDEINLTDCGFGTVIRTWIVADTYGNSQTCQQQITVTDDTPTTVDFPSDYDFYDCGIDTEPSALGEPTISNEGCQSNFEFAYFDQPFGASYPACYKILRKWTVVDWCTFVPNSGSTDGYWEHLQTIKIIDTIPPVFTCPNDTIATIKTGSCEMYISLPAFGTTDCSLDVTIKNNSPYAVRPDGDASGIYPIGTHTFTYTVTDGCGNVATCDRTIEVVDGTAPTPICIDGVTIPLGSLGEVNLLPEMLSLSSTDNCTNSNDLIYEVIPNTFNCNHVGQREVALIVTDESGNTANCELVINIQDNQQICPPPVASEASISGHVEAANGDMMETVDLELTGYMNKYTSTIENGTYMFNALEMHQTYMIKPVSPTDYLNGVTTLDLIKIRKHILNIETFETPYQFIAGDVNKSGTISTYDMVALKKVILQVNDNFGNNTSWRFVDAQYEFPDNPLQTEFPEMIQTNDLSKNEFDRNFVAVKVGDLSGNATWNFGGESENRNTNRTLMLETDNIPMDENMTYEIDITAKDFDAIEGMQLTMNFDTERLEFLKVTPKQLPNLKTTDFGLNQLKNGQITMSWEYFYNTPLSKEDILFTLQFRAKQKVELQDVFEITSQAITAEAYTYEAELLGILLEFAEKHYEKKYELGQNTPNPFVNQTSIDIYLPKTTEVTLSLYDFTGKPIHQQTGLYAKGQNQINIDLTNIPTKGIIYYHLSTPITKSLSKKMIRIVE